MTRNINYLFRTYLLQLGNRFFIFKDEISNLQIVRMILEISRYSVLCSRLKYEIPFFIGSLSITNIYFKLFINQN